MAVNNPHGYNQYTKKKKTENAGFDAEGAIADSSGDAAGALRGVSEQQAEQQGRKNDAESIRSSGA